MTTICEPPVPVQPSQKAPSRPSKHAGPAILALAFLPAVPCTDIGIAMARGWQLESKVDTLVLAASLATLMLLAVAALIAPLRRWLALRWRQCVLLGGVVALSWLLIEVALATLLPNAAEVSFHRRWPKLSVVFHPNEAFMPGVSGPAHYATNSLGIRGRELPEDRAVTRILCLGGSTTECSYLDEMEAWPGLLMGKINESAPNEERRAWVGSAGISGFGSRHHLRFVRESELMNEIDCLVLLMGVNDLSKFVETERLTAEIEREQALALAKAPFWTRSQVRNLARRVANVYLPNMTRHCEDLDGANYQLRRQERRAAAKSDGLLDLKEVLAEYALRIEQIARACRQKHVRLIVVSQPVLWSGDLDDESGALLWLGWTAHDTFLSTAALRQGMDEFNATLASTCKRLGIEMVDLSHMNGRREYFYDDCHFTELGAAEVARSIQAWIDQHPLKTRGK